MNKKNYISLASKAANTQIKELSKAQDLLNQSRQLFESFKDEYPDVYKAMQTISSQHTQEQTQKLESEINALKEKEQRLVEEQARTELLTAHSDFFELLIYLTIPLHLQELKFSLKKI